jgi:hypothetical protein
MTTLTTLAHTTPALPPFNADFYIAAVTVIPVLFVAINLQPVYRTLADNPTRRRKQNATPGRAYDWLAAWLGAGICLLQALGILAEFVAIGALDNRSAQPSAHNVILLALILLAGMAGFGPVFSFISSIEDEHKPVRHPPRRTAKPRPPSTPKWAKRAQRLQTARNLRGR